MNSKSLAGLNVLVVEDSVDNQVLMKIILYRLGATVELASDGKAGAETALSKSFDVVLMDLNMPVMDGHAATRFLREKGYAKPIVALSAHALQDERDRAKESGFTDYLTKPCQRQDLLEKILLVTAASASE